MRFVKSYPIKDLKPFSRNPRMHTELDVSAVAESVKTFGWTNPILAQEKTGRIICGHGRVLAAKQNGLLQVPVIFLDLDDQQATAYTIADNQLPTLSAWDHDQLKELIGELDEGGFDLSVLGYEPDALAELMEEASEIEEPEFSDEELPLPAKPRARLGQMWSLGKHRLICGDSTDEATVTKLLQGESPFLMVTDPPYGVEYEPVWRNDDLVRSTKANPTPVLNDQRIDWSKAYKLFPGSVVYIWHAGWHAGMIANNLNAIGFEIRSQIIWVKPNFTLSRGHYHFRHEPAWYAVRKGSTAKFCEDRTQNTVWEIRNINLIGRKKDDEQEDMNTSHSTQKPIECMARPIRNHGEEMDLVYDPFLGSGTTLMAAESLGRVCLGIELDPRYCDIVIQRWETGTGGKAVEIKKGGTDANRASTRRAKKTDKRGN